jgi:hypothetical protein
MRWVRTRDPPLVDLLRRDGDGSEGGEGEVEAHGTGGKTGGGACWSAGLTAALIARSHGEYQIHAVVKEQGADGSAKRAVGPSGFTPVMSSCNQNRDIFTHR